MSAFGAPFDAICAFHILHLVDDTRATLGRIHAHLKPGGLLISKTGAFSGFVVLILGAIAGWLGGRSGVVHLVYAHRIVSSRRRI